MSDPRRLKEAMRDPCDIAATHVRSDPVREAFRGDAEWDGVVKMFALQGCATASEAFPWSHETDSGGRRYVAVLGLPPVRSAVDAVRASMASDRRR